MIDPSILIHQRVIPEIIICKCPFFPNFLIQLRTYVLHTTYGKTYIMVYVYVKQFQDVKSTLDRWS